jgi:hypothetical protein
MTGFSKARLKNKAGLVGGLPFSWVPRAVESAL